MQSPPDYGCVASRRKAGKTVGAVCLSNVLPTSNFCNLYHSNLKSSKGECLRPYHVENTSSRLIPEVKQRRAVLVLGRVTAWEYTVL